MENTRDLSKYGYRELDMAGDLLKAYANHPQRIGLEGGVTIEFNPSSGEVFLVDEDDNVAMMNGDKLEMFYSCLECGFEGFKEDFINDGNKCCRKFLRERGKL